MDELVTAFGGQPGLKREDAWYWQFRSWGESEGNSGRATFSNPNPHSVFHPCVSCYNPSFESQPMNRAMPFETTLTSGWMTPGGGGWLHREPRVCTYIAYIENGAITRLTTLSRPGAHCRFDELPRRSTR